MDGLLSFGQTHGKFRAKRVAVASLLHEVVPDMSGSKRRRPHPQRREAVEAGRGLISLGLFTN